MAESGFPWVDAEENYRRLKAGGRRRIQGGLQHWISSKLQRMAEGGVDSPFAWEWWTAEVEAERVEAEAPVTRTIYPGVALSELAPKLAVVERAGWVEVWVLVEEVS